MITLKNVERSYKTGAGQTWVLRRVDLTIQEGEFITVMGPSGAGKSSLLNVLALLDDQWAGEYWFGEQPVHLMKRRAHPRRQFVAQLLGDRLGHRRVGPRYFVLVPDATAITGSAGHPAQFAAPAAQQWKAVAELFRDGVGNLHPMAREGIALGLLAGTVLAITEWVFPRQKRWIPSATGLGLGLLLPFSSSLSFALGALAAWVFGRASERQAGRFTVPIASGLIAGESIVGVVVAALNNFVSGEGRPLRAHSGRGSNCG